MLQFLCPAFRNLDEGQETVLPSDDMSNSPTFDTTQAGTVVSQKIVKFGDDFGERTAYTREQVQDLKILKILAFMFSEEKQQGLMIEKQCSSY